METISYPKETKARKKHRCNFCNELIFAGEVYIKSTHVYDGGMYDWKSHKHCSELADTMKMYDECDDGLTADDFMEFVSEKHHEILVKDIPEKDCRKYGDIIRQLTKVEFKEKLWFVIRFFKKNPQTPK